MEINDLIDYAYDSDDSGLDTFDSMDSDDSHRCEEMPNSSEDDLDVSVKAAERLEAPGAIKHTAKYGIRTPCILEGHKIIAFVDGGASTSFISKNFVEQNGWKIEPRPGELRQALTGANTQRIGIVKDKTLENGSHSISVDLEVADLGDNEILIIGLDLFAKLSYSIEGVPFTWPQPKPTAKNSSKPVEFTDHLELMPMELLKSGNKYWMTTNSYLKILSAIPGSDLDIETEGKPIWIRQYPIPEGYRAAIDPKVQEWIDSGVVEPAPLDCQWNFPLVAARKPGKDGEPDGVRVCFDGRELNKRIVTKTDNHLPTLREIQDHLGAFEWITVIDLADSYHQFGVNPRDTTKLAFTWGKFGHLMFKECLLDLER